MEEQAEQPKCSYINGPCRFVGTTECKNQSTITCRNIRQKNERGANHD